MWRMTFICKCHSVDPETMGSCNYRGTDRGVEQTPQKLSPPRPGVERSRSSALVYLLGPTAALLNMPLLEMSHRVRVFRPFLSQINFHFSSISQPLKASPVSLIRLQLHLHRHTISSLFPVSKLCVWVCASGPSWVSNDVDENIKMI